MLTLVKKAMRGDKEAFTALMDKHSDSLLRIAHGYLSQEADIADAIQDTILDAYEHLPSLKEPRYFKTWLIRILLNNCNHIYNRNKNYIPLEEVSENLTDTAQGVDTPLFRFREKDNSAGENTAPENSASDNTALDSSTYSQTANGVTITLSEASYSELALYFSVEIDCEEGFPEDFNWVKNWNEYILSYDFLYMTSSQQFDFSQADPALYNTDLLSCTEAERLPAPYNIEGNYADPHTFLGVIRVDLETIRQMLGVDALPPEFTYSFTIQKFWHDLNESKEVTVTSEDGKSITLLNRVKKYYDGPWSFTIPVAMNPADTQTKELMLTNADGIGIASVTKTPYEIKADIILPGNADPLDYVVAITDADGRILDSQGEIAEIYSVYGRNTDTVHIYVVDYDTFMDECKAENAYLLPEKALFRTTVEW